MIWSTLVLGFITLLLIIINIKRKNCGKGLEIGLKQFLNVLPVILVAFVLAGMLESLIPQHFVKQWLGSGAGFSGVIIGTFIGMLLAMGPYASFPIISSVYHTGAGLGTTIALISGWALLSLVYIPYESSFLGIRFTLLRMALSLPVCLAAGFIAHMIEILIL